MNSSSSPGEVVHGRAHGGGPGAGQVHVLVERRARRLGARRRHQVARPERAGREQQLPQAGDERGQLEERDLALEALGVPDERLGVGAKVLHLQHPAEDPVVQVGHRRGVVRAQRPQQVDRLQVEIGHLDHPVAVVLVGLEDGAGAVGTAEHGLVHALRDGQVGQRVVDLDQPLDLCLDGPGLFRLGVRQLVVPERVRRRAGARDVPDELQPVDHVARLHLLDAARADVLQPAEGAEVQAGRGRAGAGAVRPVPQGEQPFGGESQQPRVQPVGAAVDVLDEGALQPRGRHLRELVDGVELLAEVDRGRALPDDLRDEVGDQRVGRAGHVGIGRVQPSVPALGDLGPGADVHERLLATRREQLGVVAAVRGPPTAAAPPRRTPRARRAAAAGRAARWVSPRRTRPRGVRRRSRCARSARARPGSCGRRPRRPAPGGSPTSGGRRRADRAARADGR